MTAVTEQDAESDQLIAAVEQFAKDVIAPVAARIDADGVFPRDVYSAMAGLGLCQLWVPEQYGGVEPRLRTFLLATERIARVSGTCSLNYANGNEPTAAILLWGQPEVKDRWLPAIAGGDAIPCYAITEPGGGSDVAAISTRAAKTAGGYSITGRKVFCTNGSVGDVFVVVARTGEVDGSKGLSLFLVPADSDGLTLGRDEDLIGLRGSPTSEVNFDNVFVPDSALLGEEGAGFTQTMMILDEARLSAAAGALGIARGALDIAVEYARQRSAFGQSIIRHQGLGFLIADMTMRLAAAFALFSSAIDVLEAGASRKASVHAAMAKSVATDVAMSVTTDAVQVLGGYGLSKDFQVERMMRDAKAFQIFDGTNQVQRWIISRYLDRHGVPFA